MAGVHGWGRAGRGDTHERGPGSEEGTQMSMVVYVEVALALILAMALIGFLALTVR
jgi:hypothetical protein